MARYGGLGKGHVIWFAVREGPPPPKKNAANYPLLVNIIYFQKVDKPKGGGGRTKWIRFLCEILVFLCFLKNLNLLYIMYNISYFLHFPGGNKMYKGTARVNFILLKIVKSQKCCILHG